jgi:chromosome segregation ATPase
VRYVSDGGSLYRAGTETGEGIGQFAGLKEANAALQKALAEKELALKAAEAQLEKVSQERELVRQQIDRILQRLETLDTGEPA